MGLRSRPLPLTWSPAWITTPPRPRRDGAGTGRYPAGPLDALDAADAAFRLLATGPRPLALHASRLAAGLPDRPVPLDELRVLLLHPATSAAARNKVWAELVRRARTGGPAWVIGLTGIALPGLRRAVASLTAAYRGDPADLQSEVLTGFLAAMRGLDLDDLDAGAAGVPAVLGGLARRARPWPTPTPTTPPAAATSTTRAAPRSCPGGTRTSCWPPPSAAASSHRRRPS